MALQFIFGPSGSGKSYYIYNKIIQESMENPDRQYLVLVPWSCSTPGKGL